MEARQGRPPRRKAGEALLLQETGAKRPRQGAASPASDAAEVIPFNVPFVSRFTHRAMKAAALSGQTAGAGPQTRRCEAWMMASLPVHKALLTSSCTAALEMCALLLDVGPHDEVIVPSYTFVSTANAFALRGATLRFADSTADHPNLDPLSVAKLITPRTKAIVVVHYAGQACDLTSILDLAAAHGISVVEDAAQALGATYKGKALGTWAELSTLSFHETKNIACGEGGMLLLNKKRFTARAEILREKGTNRSSFYRREVSHYNWLDLGSSFLTSDITAAHLLAQLEYTGAVTQRRRKIVGWYRKALGDITARFGVETWSPSRDGQDNGHIFFLVCRSETQRDRLIGHLAERHIYALFHYLALHESPFARQQGSSDKAPHAERFARCLVRLPVYYRLRRDQIERISDFVLRFLSHYEAVSRQPSPGFSQPTHP